MDSEPKKAEIDEVDDEISPSAGDDEIDREEAMYDMLMEDLKEFYYSEKEKIPAGKEWNEWDYEEDTDEDEFGKICNTKNWCGRA
jgi:hypothetical protein